MGYRENLLKENWRFHYGDEPEAWYAGFDDSGWEKVFVPHDYAVGAGFDEHYSSGTGYLRGGTAWYRLHFTLPEEERGQTVKLLFDGIYKNSMVWCNSTYLGKHPSGYTPFYYNISHCARFGEDNVLCIRVSHEDLSDSRWYTGSGILRPVRILTEPPVHPAVGGIFFSADRISLKSELSHDLAGEEKEEQPLCAARAVLRLQVRMENDSDRDQTVTLRARLEEAAEAVFRETDLFLPANGEASCVLRGTLTEPRLWSPEHPQRYTLSLTCATGGTDTTGNTVTIPVGIRDLRFDPDQGFFLNGVPATLKGVCVHEDAGCLGAAVPKEVWERRLEVLKDCGCNAIRMSHNPHAEELYELCDEAGFLVMDEAFDEWENPKNKWWQGHNVYPPRHQGSYESFPDWHDRDLTAMVRRGRNHPSIILWSIGNEIDYPNDPYCHPMFDTMTGNNDANKPEAERRYDPQKPNMERIAVIARRLAAIVRREDDTREVTLAAAFPELSTHIGFIDAIRVVGYNYREQFYTEDHARFPDKVFLGSENGHGEEAWRAVTDHPYICGQFLWTGIDYLGEAHGWPIHGSAAGLLTTAGFPKERYYERQKLWLAPDMESRVETAAQESLTPGTVIEAPAGFRAVCWRPRRARSDAEPAGQWAERVQETGFIDQILLYPAETPEDPEQFPERFIEVKIEGAGELAGIDNGDLADNTPYLSPRRQTLRGNLAVYVRRTAPGEIRVRLSISNRL